MRGYAEHVLRSRRDLTMFYVCNYTPYVFMYYFVCCHLYLLSVISLFRCDMSFVHFSFLNIIPKNNPRCLSESTSIVSKLLRYPSSIFPLRVLFILLNTSYHIYKLHLYLLPSGPTAVGAGGPLIPSLQRYAAVDQPPPMQVLEWSVLVNINAAAVLA